MAITSIVIGVAGTVASYSQQKKQAKAQERAAEEQRKAMKAQQASSNYRAARERRQMVARSRVLAAQQQAGGFASGAGLGTSIVSGAVGGITSTAAGNIGASNIMQGYANQATGYNIASAGYSSQANQYGYNAGLYSGLGSFGSSLAMSPLFNSTPTSNTVIP